jgi:tungstate transport system substrate-binding protein
MKSIFYFSLTVLIGLMPCITSAGETTDLMMASTIGPIDAGIVVVLEQAYQKETGIRVGHIGAGTGAALKIAEQGKVDLVMVHAKSLEEKFIAEGYGTKRIPFMYNDFVIVGPGADPAGIKGMKNATEALSTIAAKGALFISRGDQSGTHVTEMILWQKTGKKPEGPWYKVYEKGSQGNSATLKFTDQQNAYTVIDRATFLSLQKEIRLVILVEKDEMLLNFITLIPVNPDKFPKARYKEAMAYIAWLTDPKKGQLIVRDFGKDKYGSPLFFPNSDQWKNAQDN